MTTGGSADAGAAGFVVVAHEAPRGVDIINVQPLITDATWNEVVCEVDEFERKLQADGDDETMGGVGLCHVFGPSTWAVAEAAVVKAQARSRGNAARKKGPDSRGNAVYFQGRAMGVVRHLPEAATVVERLVRGILARKRCRKMMRARLLSEEKKEPERTADARRLAAALDAERRTNASLRATIHAETQRLRSNYAARIMASLLAGGTPYIDRGRDAAAARLDYLLAAVAQGAAFDPKAAAMLTKDLKFEARRQPLWTDDTGTGGPSEEGSNGEFSAATITHVRADGRFLVKFDYLVFKRGPFRGRFYEAYCDPCDVRIVRRAP